MFTSCARNDMLFLVVMILNMFFSVFLPPVVFCLLISAETKNTEREQILLFCLSKGQSFSVVAYLQKLFGVVLYSILLSSFFLLFCFVFPNFQAGDCWKAGVRADFLPTESPTLAEQLDYAQDLDIQWILWVNHKTPNVLKLKHVSKKTEIDVPRNEVVKFFVNLGRRKHSFI